MSTFSFTPFFAYCIVLTRRTKSDFCLDPTYFTGVGNGGRSQTWLRLRSMQKTEIRMSSLWRPRPLCKTAQAAGICMRCFVRAPVPHAVAQDNSGCPVSKLVAVLCPRSSVPRQRDVIFTNIWAGRGANNSLVCTPTPACQAGITSSSSSPICKTWAEFKGCFG